MINFSGFYLGASSAEGFYSLFDELYNPYDGWRVFILKGGPGTGKSSTMKKVAKICAECGMDCEEICCSSDPESLDAIIFHAEKLCVADGTAPHVLEPVFPGACEEIVNLGGLWDSDSLFAHRNEIKQLSAHCASMHARCSRFMGAARSLLEDNRRIADSCTDSEKTQRYVLRTAARKFGSGKAEPGKETRRLLTAVTPLGITQSPLAEQSGLCADMTVLDDEYGAASRAIIPALRDAALLNGLDVISCPCPLRYDNVPEHLFVPDADFGIVTSNSRHRFNIDGATKLRAARFMSAPKLKENRCRIAFCKNTAEELLGEAVFSLQGAAQYHTQLEDIYKKAMDFSAVSTLAEQLADKLIAAAGAIG